MSRPMSNVLAPVIRIRRNRYRNRSCSFGEKRPRPLPLSRDYSESVLPPAERCRNSFILLDSDPFIIFYFTLCFLFFIFYYFFFYFGTGRSGNGKTSTEFWLMKRDLANLSPGPTFFCFHVSVIKHDLINSPCNRKLIPMPSRGIVKTALFSESFFLKLRFPLSREILQPTNLKAVMKKKKKN